MPKISANPIYGIDPKPEDIRAFSRYLQPNGETGCLIFTGTIHHSGYGHFKLHGRIMEAHRAAWFLSGRKLTPEKPYVLHHCDNRLCCELSHLYAGNAQDNANDLARRGRGTRSPRGLPYGASKRESGRFRSLVRIRGTLHHYGTYDSWAEASAIAFYHRNLELQKTGAPE